MPDAGRILSIDPGQPFLDALAAGLLHEAGDQPGALGDYLVLLPTRRACRALGEAFLRVGDGRALILPDIQPLGDIDEEALSLRLSPADSVFDLPPAIPEIRRRLLLARLILARPAMDGPGGDRATPDQAVRLADELARLIDQAQTERLDFDRLAALAPADYASHWQEVIAFLSIVTENWPKILAEQGCIDPADRRNRLLEAQAALWQAAAPQTPVIAAGSTGSIPATADLLTLVAGLPRGRIVLPGLDREIDEATRQAALADAGHPQHGMLRLLQRLSAMPADVLEWDAGKAGPARSSPPARRRLVAEAMRPAATSDAWRQLRGIPADALRGVQRIDCANETEEAGAIALMLRHALETGNRTAALVTPDRQLARRVAAELMRWNIEIDDSAGSPLSDTPPGAFLRLVARAAADGLAPVALLSALKHPLATGGMARGDFRETVRALETRFLRGPRPAPGIAGLRDLLAASQTESAPPTGVVDAVEHCLGPLVAALSDGKRDLAALLDEHLRAAEALAASDAEDGTAQLWAGEQGETLAATLTELREAAEDMAPLRGADYPALFEALLAGASFRPRYGLHPRLHIWGPLEARLLHADLMVLGGLNEGSWPPDPGNDPWMSRPMRAAFGLPAPERRIGLAAHDFAQAFAAPAVVLTRATKVEGAPTVPSRWLTRLDAVLQGAGVKDGLAPARPWTALHHALSRPSATQRIAPPAPRPPVAARPRALSVTRIETWMREPYAIFADRILGLRPLDPLEADPGAAERGSFIHEALDSFMRDNPGPLPPDALDRLMACGEAAFGAALGRPGVRAFWWPRFRRIAEWFLARERERRAGGIEASHTEVQGRIEFDGPAGPFRLTAKADRIDRLAGGGYVIIDYKTGLPPSKQQVEYGYAPQLPLEAVILAEGGFEGVAAGKAAELAYWRLSGGEPAGEIKPVSADAETLAAQARQGLVDLISAFDNPETPYLATPRPEWASPWNDYEHLARTREWSAGGGEES